MTDTHDEAKPTVCNECGAVTFWHGTACPACGYEPYEDPDPCATMHAEREFAHEDALDRADIEDYHRDVGFRSFDSPGWFK